VIIRSVLAEEARVRMDDALTVVDTLPWMRCSMSRVASLCIRVSVLLSVFGVKKRQCGGSSGAHG
jgi:hypothetical protein